MLLYGATALSYPQLKLIGLARVMVSIKAAFLTIILTLTVEGKRGGGSESE